MAWIGLLGGYLVPRFTVYLELFGSDTLEEAVQETLVVQAIATGMVVIGATFLVVLIWWIERRIVRRRAAQLAGEPAPAVAGNAIVVGAAPSAGAAPAGRAVAPRLQRVRSRTPRRPSGGAPQAAPPGPAAGDL